MEKVTDYFGSMVFDERVMKAMLSEKVYKSLKRTIDKGQPLDTDVADAVAAAMKDWAVEKGATHYTHWFQPMTGVTAEKHDSFISPAPDGRVIMEFSGKELIKGEPDASSFPSGGLRATFEARGYTAWDPTSFAFIKDGTLYIPTAFCSYGGEALDKKVPLLRSMDALNVQAMRILKLFGTDATCVKTSVGPEQEYFLIPKELYDKREDLIMTGRTLFGAPAPKGQEMEDHYFGAIPVRVARFMQELNEELWKLGIYAKTEHNEVAPGQFELATIYQDANIGVDQNQVVMDILGRVAYKHGYACLLHEKPFKYCNGSGKHNNYSLVSNTGCNVFDYTQAEETRFLLFVTAFIAAVDRYAELLRVSVATAGNDHRLGANEAPPAILSVYLGEYYEELIHDYITHDDSHLNNSKDPTNIKGIKELPPDDSDRNRTSPMAFTGNKFEFRMLGSNLSGAFPNTVLNTILADIFFEISEKLKRSTSSGDSVKEIIRENYEQHQRILFSGNGYSEEWVSEAERRGLPNIRNTMEAIGYLTQEKNVELFARYGIFSETELESRRNVLIDQYISTVGVEIKTLLMMTNRYILPSIAKEIRTYENIPTSSFANKRVSKLSSTMDLLEEKWKALSEKFDASLEMKDTEKRGMFVCEELLPIMEEMRNLIDSYEMIADKAIYPLPTYTELLF